jgi:hypothetical protein
MFLDIVDYFKQAHETGDLNNEQRLKLALQYENKIGTQIIYTQICKNLEAFPDCNLFNKDAEELLDSNFYNAASGLDLITNCRSLLTPSANPPKLLNNLMSVAKISEVIGRNDLISSQVKAIKAYGNLPDKRLARIEAFNWLWKDYSKERKNFWIWLFDKPATDNKDAYNLLFELGLYQKARPKVGDEYLQIQFKIDRCYKPSWLDAKMAFYFDSAGDSVHHGYTRNLLTGSRGYKEWISLVTHLKLQDVVILTLDKEPELDVLPEPFQNAHSLRIGELRSR